MCKKDDYVSPYLQRPLRSYEEAMREQEKRAGGTTKRETEDESRWNDADTEDTKNDGPCR